MRGGRRGDGERDGVLHPHLYRPLWVGAGAMTPDWALIVPVPASIAANKEVLFSQFGETVPLVHCLRSVDDAGWGTADLVVAVAEVLYTDVQALLAANGMAVTVIAVGGLATLEECLVAGLAAVGSSVLYVLIHDIRRALASSGLVQRIMGGLRHGDDIVIPALSMVDSVKAVDATGAVTETVDRALLRSAQYPRGFHRRHLAPMLADLNADEFDELSLSRRSGISTTVIDGDPDAFALVLPRDVGLADAIYSCRLADQR